MKDKIDIKFIAGKAQVSPATVSRVLNKSKAVSPELKSRVLSMIEKYDYRPNEMARGLIFQKSNLIGIITPRVANAFNAELISQIEKRANQAHYDVIISNISGNFENEKKAFRIMHDRRVDGIILLHENTPEEMAELQRISDIPIVLASVRVEGSSLPNVSIDDERAAYEATRYLIQLRHMKIAGVFSDSYSAGNLRKKGFLDCLSAQNIAPFALFIGECTFHGGAVIAERILALQEKPTAVFFISDEMAIGAINYFQDHRVRVPEDISVFSFDDIELASYVRPRLSTVHQPVREIGQYATEMLLALIEKRPLYQPQQILPHHVIIRDSCAALEN